MSSATQETVLYDAADGIASITMHRPALHNAQDAEMARALDAAFRRAAADEHVKVIVLRGAGQHFSVGHDAGREQSASPEHPKSFGEECPDAHEEEAYLAMCRRLRELPKPTIAMVQGACIASGLLLAWVCDLIIASDDTVFSDSIVRMGIPNIEIYSYACELHPRIAKEFLFLGERMGAQRAYQMGMVNRVVPRHFLEEEAYCMAARIAQMPAPGLALAKQAVNRTQGLAGRPAVTNATTA